MPSCATSSDRDKLESEEIEHNSSIDHLKGDYKQVHDDPTEKVSEKEDITFKDRVLQLHEMI